MADIDQFTKLFKAMDIDYATESVTSADARDLARITAESLAGKSAKYLMVGSTFFHFNWKGQFIGIESTSFEPRPGIEMPDPKAEPEEPEEPPV